MKLRNKLLAAVGLAWIFFLCITYAGSQVLLRQSFLNLERATNERNLTRIDAALTQNVNSLYTFTADWAHWNALYDYMEGKNTDFISNDIAVPSLINSTIDFIMLWNNQKTLQWGTAVDLEGQQLLPLPTVEKRQVYFSTNSPLISQKDLQTGMQGFIHLDKQIYLVAAAAITDAKKLKPSIGSLVTGRKLDNMLITNLANLVQLNLKLILIDDVSKDKNSRNAFVHSLNNKGHYHILNNEFSYESYTVIYDIYNHPIGMIQATGIRLSYLTGLKTIHYWLVSFILFGLIISGLLLYLIRRLIIEPIDNLNQQVVEIGEHNELKRRVVMPGDDELSAVANKINHLLTIIQGAQEELENRVAQRTKELKETNIHLSEEIAERKSVEKELLINKEHLLQLSHYDTLTSLPNRVFFNEILNKAINNAKQNKKQLALLIIDLDRFKNINDALGQPTGDLVLKEIAYRFSKLLRPGDVLARLGGDEFIVLLNDIADPKMINSIADTLLAHSVKPIKINTHDFFITASIGISIFPEDGTTLEDLQRNADVSMSKAKQKGGNVFEYFAKEMNYEANENIQLEAALHKAINNKEFVLNFQPKLSLEDGNIVGVEALLRWDSPELGTINPDQFIPLAEENGMIMQIGEWVLRQACFINKNWQTQGYKPICISVNLSPKQFRNPELPQIIKSVLQETKLEPRYLELEITETTVMDNIETAINRLNIIKDMGVAMSIDDFGMGYTSISYLKRFPIDTLKIDQSFIKGIPENQNDVAITRGVIALAHSLDLKVVAEGVETPEQMKFLSDHRCDYIQGYFISRPLSERKIVLLLNKMNSNQELD